MQESACPATVTRRSSAVNASNNAENLQQSRARERLRTRTVLGKRHRRRNSDGSRQNDSRPAAFAASRRPDGLALVGNVGQTGVAAGGGRRGGPRRRTAGGVPCSLAGLRRTAGG